MLVVFVGRSFIPNGNLYRVLKNSNAYSLSYCFSFSHTFTPPHPPSPATTAVATVSTSSCPIFLIQYLFLIPSFAFSHVHSSFSSPAPSCSYPVSCSHSLSLHLHTPPFSSTISKFLFGLEARTLLNTEFYCHTIYNYYVLHESVTQGYMICTVDIRKWECYSKPLLIRFPGQLLSMTFSPCSPHLYFVYNAGMDIYMFGAVCEPICVCMYYTHIRKGRSDRESESASVVLFSLFIVEFSWRAAVRDYYKCY